MTNFVLLLALLPLALSQTATTSGTTTTTTATGTPTAPTTSGSTSPGSLCAACTAPGICSGLQGLTVNSGSCQTNLRGVEALIAARITAGEFKSSCTAASFTPVFCAQIALSAVRDCSSAKPASPLVTMDQCVAAFSACMARPMTEAQIQMQCNNLVNTVVPAPITAAPAPGVAPSIPIATGGSATVSATTAGGAPAPSVCYPCTSPLKTCKALNAVTKRFSLDACSNVDARVDRIVAQLSKVCPTIATEAEKIARICDTVASQGSPECGQQAAPLSPEQCFAMVSSCAGASEAEKRSACGLSTPLPPPTAPTSPTSPTSPSPPPCTVCTGLTRCAMLNGARMPADVCSSLDAQAAAEIARVQPFACNAERAASHACYAIAFMRTRPTMCWADYLAPCASSCANFVGSCSALPATVDRASLCRQPSGPDGQCWSSGVPSAKPDSAPAAFSKTSAPAVSASVKAECSAAWKAMSEKTCLDTLLSLPRASTTLAATAKSYCEASTGCGALFTAVRTKCAGDVAFKDSEGGKAFMRVARVIIAAEVACATKNPDSSTCLDSFAVEVASVTSAAAVVSTAATTTSAPSEAQLTARCSPCFAKQRELRQAFASIASNLEGITGMPDARAGGANAANEGIECAKDENGKFCLLVLPELNTKIAAIRANAALSDREKYVQVNDLVCSSRCHAKMFKAAFKANTQGGLAASTEDADLALRARCMRSDVDPKPLCITVFDTLALAAPSCKAFFPTASDVGATCPAACASEVQAWAKTAGCCLSARINSLVSEARSRNEDTTKAAAQQKLYIDFARSCGISASYSADLKACPVPKDAIALGRIKLENMDFKWSSDPANKPQVEQVTREVISDATGVPASSISVTTMTSGSTIIDYSVECSSATESTQVSKDLTTSAKSGSVDVTPYAAIYAGDSPSATVALNTTASGSQADVNKAKASSSTTGVSCLAILAAIILMATHL